jgi:hypothetical protein
MPKFASFDAQTVVTSLAHCLAQWVSRLKITALVEQRLKLHGSRNSFGNLAIFTAIRRALPRAAGIACCAAASSNWQSGRLEEGRTQGQFREAQVSR